MKSLVINLEKSKQRWLNFVEANGDALDDIERIEAVDGRLINDKRQHLSAWMHLTHEPSKFNIGPTIGCFLSHRSAWQKVIDEELPYALILEDDIEATDRTRAFLAAYEANPLPFDWVKLHVNRKPNRNRQVSVGLALDGIELCVDMAGSKSAGAYIITQQGAQKLSGFRKLLAPIDHVEWLHQQFGLVFAQTRENIFEFATGLGSNITPQGTKNVLRRLPATVRIELVRATIGRTLLRSNLRAARRLASQYSSMVHA